MTEIPGLDTRRHRPARNSNGSVNVDAAGEFELLSEVDEASADGLALSEIG